MVAQRSMSLVFLLLLTQGCIAMAAESLRGGTNLTGIQIGTPREAVERQLGKPIKSYEKDGMQIADYEFFPGCGLPSADDAIGSFLSSVATFGLLDLAIISSAKPPVTITYDQDGKLSRIERPDVRCLSES